MIKHTLEVQPRKITGRKVKKLRREGILPANLYGKGRKSLALQLPLSQFLKVFTQAGETGLVQLLFEEKKVPVLIHNVQSDPLTGKPLHADFYQVDLKEKVTAKVPLVFVGEAKAVAEKTGVLLNILSELEVSALPTDLPEKIEVEVSSLKAVGEVLRVKDLKVSEKIKILTPENLEIVRVAPLISKEAAEQIAQEKEAAEAAGKAETAIPASAASSPKGEEEKSPPQSQEQTS